MSRLVVVFCVLSRAVAVYLSNVLVSFSAKSEEDLFRKMNFTIRESDGDGKFIVNPYGIPTKLTTVKRFFKQLEHVPRLAMFSEEVADDRYYDESTKKRLYDFVAGEKTNEKKEIMVDCLMEFRKTLIDDSVSYIDVMQAQTRGEKIRMLKLHPVVVECLYLQLFCELSQYNVQFSAHDFEIGKVEHFRFDRFYCEDHPLLFYVDKFSLSNI